MANYRTVAVTEDQYALFIKTIREGFSYEGVVYEPNERIAAILTTETNLGLRVGDIVNLRLKDIILDGHRRRLDIIEEKTGKSRTFTVPHAVYGFLSEYANNNGIKPSARLFPITEREVQKHLKHTREYLECTRISTHSFRKFFATQIYVKNNYNIALVQKILQHSTAAVTQRYIGIEQKDIENALENNVNLV